MRPTNELNAESWLARHGDVLYCYALRYTASLDEAEDLVQETLLSAWRGRGRFRGEGSERTWFLREGRHS